MLSSLFEVDVCSLTNAGEQTGTRRKQGGQSGGAAGVPEGPDCTGSTVTACWRGLCGTAGIEAPAGHAREDLRRMAIQESMTWRMTI